MASLVIRTGSRTGTRLALQEDRTVLGRDAVSDVIINDSMLNRAAGRTTSVSRKHALISCVAGHYYIEDGDGKGNRSRNGTFVNDQPVPFPGRVRLRNDDKIRI